MMAEKVTIGNCELWHGDCMDYMRGLPDKAFDLAIVDPPYGIGVAALNFGARDVKNESCDGKQWDNTTPPDEYFAELERVSVDRIIWGANYFNCFSNKHGAIIWDKQNPMPTSSQCEIASYSKHQRVAYYRQTWTNYVNTKATTHPTEKPVKLYEWLLTNYAKPGQRILDTHLGSGSSAIACNNMGFEMVGCELDADYYAAACKRIKQAAAQPRLFEDAPVGAGETAVQGDMLLPANAK